VSRARDAQQVSDDLEPGAVNAPESTEFDAQPGQPDDHPAVEDRRGTADLARSGAGMVRDVAVNMATALRRPLASFHLVLGLTAVLTVLGLVMVLSASSVEDISATGSPYSKFTSQLMYVGLGVVAFFVALYLRPTLLRRVALGGVLVSIALLIAVLIPRAAGSTSARSRCSPRRSPRWRSSCGARTCSPTAAATVASRNCCCRWPPWPP
jgi:cell division protein FtsW